MPRRKSIRKQLAEVPNKQLKIITARLIEIRLKVDDYIYKRKPISVANAQSYIEEVCSYRKYCERDARSLQVIDKLMNQMKSIIAEQEEIKYSDNIYDMIKNSCTRDYETSPVYSLADSNVADDQEVSYSETRVFEETWNKYQTINSCENDVSNTDINNDNIYEIIQNSCTRDDETSPVYSLANSIVADCDSETRILKETSEDFETIKLCCADVDNIGTLINKNEIQDAIINGMQKSLSAMSLKQADDPIDTNPDDELGKYSQSIINGSLPLTQMTQDNTVKNTNNAGIIDNSTTSHMFNKNEDSSNNNALGILNEINMDSKGKRIFPISENTLIEKNTSYKSEVLKNKDKPGRKRKPKATTAKKLNNKRNNNPKKRNSKKSVNVESEKVPTGYKNNKIICPLPKNPNKQDNSFDIPKICAKENVSRRNFSNFTCNIYNDEVVDDLSWIENIRYVKEVALDEFDPKLTYLDESFWNNYALPDNWDDRDFLL